MRDSTSYDSIGEQSIIDLTKSFASGAVISILIIGSWLSLITIFLLTRPIQMMRESVVRTLKLK